MFQVLGIWGFGYSEIILSYIIIFLLFILFN